MRDLILAYMENYTGDRVCSKQLFRKRRIMNYQTGSMADE